ncbi:MAG: tetratricopeptide repeat protein [Gemmatimonadales bacterium]|nr:tetratricopeptide repeat protein [Gemmatimonadales bacterium]
MNLKKLKESARKHEQKEDWQKAIKVYLRAIEASESGLDAVPDLSLYNRVGDLYMKVNDTALAVKTYERAVDLYADQGFANNAIAICGKILRVDPGRMQTYLTLAKLYARKNFVVDAKKNLLEYLDRMNRANRREHAFREVSGFAEQFHGEVEIRDMLRELVQAASRETHSAEELDKLAAKLETGPVDGGVLGGPAGAGTRNQKGRPGDLVFLDTSASMPVAEPELEPEVPEIVPPPEVPELSEEPEIATPVSDLPLLDLGEEEADVVPAAEDGAVQAEVEEELEVEEEAGPDDAVSEVIGEPDEELEGVEPTVVGFDEVDKVEILEGLEDVEGLTAEERAAMADQELDVGVEPTALDAIELESVPTQLDDLETTEFEGLEAAPEADEEVLEIVEEIGEEEEEVGVDEDVPGLEPVGESIEGDQPPAAPWEEEEVTDPIAEQAEEAAASIEDLSISPSTVGHEQTPAALEPLEFEDLVDEEASPEEEFEFVEEIEVEADSEAVEAVPTPEVSSEPGMPNIASLEERLANTPGDPFAHRALGEGLIVTGSKDRGLYELELALAGFENRQDWSHSTDVLRELIRLDPNRIWYYQKRVELAYRSGEKNRLVDAYLELGDVLVRVGSVEKALAVYGRVLEHDPSNEFAQAALDVLQPVSAAEAVRPPVSSGRGGVEVDEEEEASEDEYVDLGALVLEPKPLRDTRIRIEDEEPTGDEARDFELMLEQFKAALEESLTDEDYQAHYDLGVAFKEMGLLDEAIAEFQKALRAPEGRLRTSEALGVSFFEKGQFAVAEAILRRAVDGISGWDDEKIGLLYWLGRSTESLGQVSDALGAYERAMAVDVGFMDINDRVKRLTAGLG